MNINRNNYEEYFLLYADNELSPTEKDEVEIFVQQNVDLEEEFNMIKLTINFPDKNVGMTDKSFLIKNENSSFIDENNYESVFVLYHDQELSNEQKKQTEEFLKGHPKYYIDFELFGKSKLTTDENIAFPAKRKLYKKEKTGRVIPLILWRSVAAAAFIGFALWTLPYYLNKNEGIRAVAFKENTIKSLSSTNQYIIKEKQDTENIVTSSSAKREGNNLKEKEKKILSYSLAKTNEKKQNTRYKKSIPVKKDNDHQVLATDYPVNDFPDPVIKTKPLPITDAQPQTDNQQNVQQAAYAQNASYAIDNSGNDENYIFFHVKAEDFNKSKVGGFLKKVKRMVERTNPIGRLLSGEGKQVASN